MRNSILRLAANGETVLYAICSPWGYVPFINVNASEQLSSIPSDLTKTPSSLAISTRAETAFMGTIAFGELLAYNEYYTVHSGICCANIEATYEISRNFTLGSQGVGSFPLSYLLLKS